MIDIDTLNAKESGYIPYGGEQKTEPIKINSQSIIAFVLIFAVIFFLIVIVVMSYFRPSNNI